MNLIKPAYLMAACLVCTIWLSSCTNTYTPELKCRPDDITNSLRDPYGFEDVGLSAETSIGIKGKHDKLIIKLTNGSNIPQDYTAAIALAKSLLKKILPKVQDADQYDSYQISFITNKTVDSNTQTNEMAIDLDKDAIK